MECLVAFSEILVFVIEKPDLLLKLSDLVVSTRACIAREHFVKECLVNLESSCQVSHLFLQFLGLAALESILSLA